MLMAYFGGKFPFSYKDFSLENLSKDYRAKLIGTGNLSKQPLNFPMIRKGLVYSGPFYFYDVGDDAESVVQREIETVIGSDVCYFLIDKDGAQPGTVTEIINATLHKKIVKIFYVQKDLDVGEPERDISSPLWYPIIFANKMNKENTFVKAFPTLEEAENALVADVYKED